MGMALHELPLALFTTIAPIGAGAFVALFIAFLKGNFTAAKLKAVDKYTILPIFVALVGMACSVPHLTNANNAVNVLNTIGSSPLANEMTAFGVFLVLACLYWIIGVAGGLKNHGFRLVCSGIVAVAALVFAVFVGFAYALPTQPVWNTLWTPAQIVGIELFGGMVMGMIVLISANADACVEDGADNALAAVAIVGFVLACLATCVIWYLGSVAVSPVLDVAANAGSLVVFLVLFIIFGIIGVVCAFFTAKIGSLSLLGWASLVVIIVACFFARLVFYGMQIGIGF
ncbi:MAG: dimethyl sulfoxide reductase anchor subunit [Coriobacteriia bacterium]|nr:dimethyl sulfoxide reductase anchor subunit [Coriobacteriia bacterium]